MSKNLRLIFSLKSSVLCLLTAYVATSGAIPTKMIFF